MFTQTWFWLSNYSFGQQFVHTYRKGAIIKLKTVQISCLVTSVPIFLPLKLVKISVKIVKIVKVAEFGRLTSVNMCSNTWRFLSSNYNSKPNKIILSPNNLVIKWFIDIYIHINIFKGQARDRIFKKFPDSRQKSVTILLPGLWLNK